ncbi:hypothetical protein [Chromobacterium phragmitis]|uniref:hypothetical protein n=1 Tax=Chromobacterium phragmitis TaxID=2202141 RepID=UPI0011AE3C1B|nr:hypothetical protein [Chromobacterium phragmitis]
MPSLDTALEHVYQVFSAAGKPRAIPACPCCLSLDETRALLAMPLKTRTPAQLSGYAKKSFSPAADRTITATCCPAFWISPFVTANGGRIGKSS